MKNIVFVLLLIIALSSCVDGITKDQNKTRIGGHFIVANDGELQKVSDKEAIGLIENTRNSNGAVTGEPANILLTQIGHSVDLKKGELFNLNVKIDETVATIESKYNESTETLTLTVIPINKTRKVVMKNICDIVYIPSGDVGIEIKDEYNITQASASKKTFSKIIIVPTFDENCNVNGHYVRFDTDNRSKCPDKKIVGETNKAINDCEKKDNGRTTPPGPCGNKTNCPEWRMFRICCP